MLGAETALFRLDTRHAISSPTLTTNRLTENMLAKVSPQVGVHMAVPHPVTDKLAAGPIDSCKRSAHTDTSRPFATGIVNRSLLDEICLKILKIVESS